MSKKQTINLTPSQFATALRKDDSLQLMKKQVVALNDKINTLNKSLANCDSTAWFLQLADNKSQDIIKSKDGIIKDQQSKIDLNSIYTKALKQTIRRKKTTITIISGLSIGTTATLTYLLLKK